MGKAKKIGIGIGIAVAAFFVLIIVVGAVVMSSRPSIEGDQTVNENPTPITSDIDTNRVQARDLAFSITNATQEGRVISVIVMVENLGDRIETVSWQTFRLIDGSKNLYEDARAFPPDKGQLSAMGEIAPGGSREFKYVYSVPEDTELADCQFVVLEDSRNLKYLDLV
jgi:hypothetical protein